ncbi:MAG: YscO family type III secretion system apparatus protein [Pseudomonadota bacterium]
MSLAMYRELLRVKRLREDTAKAELRDSEAMLRAARSAAERADEMVESFHAERLLKEKRLFDEIKGVAVLVRDIDDMKAKIERLRAEEEELRKRASKAHEQVTEAENDVATARTAVKRAEQITQKFEEFVDIEKERVAIAQAEREEAETEEVSEAIFAAQSRAQGR